MFIIATVQRFGFWPQDFRAFLHEYKPKFVKFLRNVYDSYILISDSDDRLIGVVTRNYLGRELEKCKKEDEVIYDFICFAYLSKKLFCHVILHYENVQNFLS